MVNLFLPDFYFNSRMNQAFIELKEKSPEKFYDDCNIKAVYGVFPTSIWNGEVYCAAGAANDNAKETTAWYNDRGVALVNEFTNCNLQPFHVYDNACNIYCKIMENDLNYCNIVSNELFGYIASMYPKFKFISSSAKQIWELEDLKKELSDVNYSYVIANPVFNPEKELLNLPNKDKLILVANSSHKYSCPNDSQRCKYMSQMQLDYGLVPPDSNKFSCASCGAINDGFYDVMRSRKHFITQEDMYGKFQEAGINNFYIYGRGYNAFDVLEAYIYYMIKPEYQDHTRLAMMITLE